MLCLLLASLSLIVAMGAVGVAEEVDNDSSPTHEDPDEAAGEGDAEAAADWLRDRLERSLGESSIHIEQGEYDAASEAVGDEYNETLSRFVEVSGETGREEDAEAAEELESAGEDQRQLSKDIEEYDRTYEEYQEAVEAGDTERARDLARDLEELSESIEERSESLDESYDRIDQASDRDVSEQREATERVRSDVESRQQEIRDAEFLATELEVEGTPTEISFTDPMDLSGTLVTEEGDPVANEPITLEIDGQNVTTTTDANGGFTATYRPTVLPLDATQIDVEYVPDPGSPYGTSSASLPVSVEQTDSELEITESTDTVAFDGNVTVEGSVSADGTGADGVPVTVLVDDEPIGEGRTLEDGTFVGNGTLPANVSAGEADVEVVTDLENAALAESSDTTTVTIEETPSELTMTVEPFDDRTIYVGGRLTTADGTALEEQTIELDVAGETTTVETDEDGEYEATVALPDDASGSVTVVATYADAGTNVGDSTAEVSIDVGDDTSGLASLGVLGSVIAGLEIRDLVLGAGVLVSLVVLGLAVRRARWGKGGASKNGALGRPMGRDSESTDGFVDQLRSARRRLGFGEYDRAVEIAYAAVRAGINRGGPDGRTHWEFYEGCRSNGLSPEDVDRLGSITERFEHAAFAPYGLSEEEANSAVADAERLLRRSD